LLQRNLQLRFAPLASGPSEGEFFQADGSIECIGLKRRLSSYVGRSWFDIRAVLGLPTRRNFKPGSVVTIAICDADMPLMVLESSADTEAPLITAPLDSETRPRIEPRTACAAQGEQDKKATVLTSWGECDTSFM
jgi:hypothetical protein